MSDSFGKSDITRLNNLLRDYRDHMIQQCAEKNTALYNTKDEGQIVVDCIELIDDSISTLKNYL